MVSAAKKNSRTENSLIWYNILTKGWSLSLCKPPTLWTVTLAKKFQHTGKSSYYIFTAILFFSIFWFLPNDDESETHIALCFCIKEGQKYSMCSPRCMQAKDKGLFWKPIFTWYSVKPCMISPIVKFSSRISSFQHFNELTCTNGKGSSSRLCT